MAKWLYAARSATRQSSGLGREASLNEHGWDVAVRSGVCLARSDVTMPSWNEPNPLQRLKLTAMMGGMAPSRNQNCNDERLFKRSVFARYDRHHEKCFGRGGCVAARTGQFCTCAIDSRDNSSHGQGGRERPGNIAKNSVDGTSNYAPSLMENLTRLPSWTFPVR